MDATTLTTTRFVPICRTLPAETSPSKSVPVPTTAVELETTATVPVRALVDAATGAAKPVEFVKAIQTDCASGPVWTLMPCWRCSGAGLATSGRTIWYLSPLRSNSGGLTMATAGPPDPVGTRTSRSA